MNSIFARLHPGRVEWGDVLYRLQSRVLRTKPVDTMLDGSGADTHGTQLARVLTTVDLVSLGVGSCVGTGMYVVAGLVAKEMAGAGVILSFCIAAMASILSGVCYAEFGVRVPKTTGSAYTYSYVTVGEFVAFFIGWNLVLEYLIGTAAGASALSSMFDSLANHSISHFMIDHLGTLHGLGKGEQSYPDVLALFIAALVTVIVALGVKNSVGLNNILNVVNLVVWVFIMIAGLFFVNPSNWGDGRFLPHGWTGVMQGAATCFYAFIGFDIIATTGEEAKSPNTSIPYAITASLVTCLTAYVSVSVILTLLVPYNKIDGDAPLMEMFVVHGFGFAKFVVAVGAVAGLTVSLLGSLFPMPRVIYAMAGDGLLFRFLAHVSPFTETPVVACVASGSLAALLALLVSLRDLIEMMSIGTLLAYTLVSVCVLLLRYQPDAGATTVTECPPEDEGGGEDEADGKMGDGPAFQQGSPYQGATTQDEYDGMGDNACGAKNLPSGGDGEMLYDEGPDNICTALLRRLLGPRYHILRARLGLPGRTARPTPATGRIVTKSVLMLFVWAFLFFGAEREGGGWGVLSVLLMVPVAGSLLLVIMRQPENPRKLPYMAPCVPLVPACAIIVNVYLMLKLSRITWIRFVVWCLLGLVIYFSYGMWNSNLELHAREEEASASSYQRYDGGVDDSFGTEDAAPYPQDDDEPYQGWGAQQEGGYQQQYQAGPPQWDEGDGRT
ncbi:probable cationic amino acid transporter [Paramormyrops kingsleyae]|uniref:Solute carrier family 7 member 14b n=1 Tax=Paramormyrops kingsleyae TaxID=1676925 RepID=A0A3B3TG62_9TELE|nr:probable cationic amino acid transporter [Paramormyrops kingsleyae]